MDILPGEIFLSTYIESNMIAVSNLGQIFRPKKSGRNYGSLSPSGYMIIRINNRVFSIHRLVALMFIS